MQLAEDRDHRKRWPGAWPGEIETLELDADDRLLALLGADFANPMPLRRPPHRRWAAPPSRLLRDPAEWQKIASGHWVYTPPPEPPETPKPPQKPYTPPRRRHGVDWPPPPPKWRHVPLTAAAEYQPLIHDLWPQCEPPAWIARSLEQGRYRNMDDVASDARLFIYGIGSRYFAEVVVALRNDLISRQESGQVMALDALCARLVAMRDLLEQRLAEMAGPSEPDPAEPTEDPLPVEERLAELEDLLREPLPEGRRIVS